ncbi:MAG TPA: arylsulfotransferase family protein [Cytophagaceae bacterium]|jgi:hypothetical protein|nr:arylsulfotransferase family protein [Cytophagaceae bacterium]
MKLPIKHIIRGLSILVLFLFLLSYYSYLIYNAAIEGKESGFVAHHLTNFANYPRLVKEVLTSNELSGIPPTYIELDSSFHETNHLNYDLFALNSFWNMHTNAWDIKLFNLKNDSLEYKWTLAKQGLDFTTTDYNFPNAMPRNCIVFPDRSIIVSTDEAANLMRLDAHSQPIWINHQFIYHHSLNLDADSNIWACTSDLNHKGQMPVKAIRNINGTTYRYKEEYITKVDKNTGKVLFRKGVAELLTDNHYSNFVYGFSDPDKNAHNPIHLNDIQPVLKDGKYWKKGDLFLSLRHRSLIILYRPSTNKIIRLIFGEFINQHDVDIISDTEISIFNNNFIHFERDSVSSYCIKVDTLASSEIVTYDFQDSSFKKMYAPYLKQEHIWTETQGIHKILENGDTFIESQNQGKIFIINDSGVVMRKMLHAPLEHYAYHPNWIRIYEKLPYKK